MKATRCLVMCLLLSSLLAVSQTGPQADSESIVAARSQYERSEADLPPGSGPLGNETGAGKGLLAQYPRGRGYRPPASPSMGFRGGYSPMAFGEGSGRHVLIGALIGFGLGAAVGAKGNTDPHPGAGVKAAFLVGGIGALLGAAVGSGVPSLQPRYRHRGGPWPDQDEEASLRRRRKGVALAATNQNRPPDDPAKTAVVPLAKEPAPVPPASEY